MAPAPIEPSYTEVRSNPTYIAVAPVLLLLTGCVLVGPDYTPPEPQTPDLWQQDLLRGLGDGSADLRSWWTLLGDPLLDSLIERADQGNLDLRRAVSRIQEARAVRGITTSARYPEVDGTGTLERQKTSEQVLPAPFGGNTTNFYSLGTDAFWELDLWGRVSRSIESADAGLQATIEDYRDVQVSMYAEVATTYVEVRALQARIAYARSNVRTQRGSLQLTVDRRDAGIGSDLEVAQADQNLARSESAIPALQIRLATAIHSLAVLLGEIPSALYPELSAEAPIPQPPDEVGVGLPADLLRQRPDIRRAERELASQTAQIGVATAELYPTFVLNGDFSIDAFGKSGMFDAGSTRYGFGPSLRWNLFSGGRVRNQIRAEDARTQQSLARYEEAVLRGLEDVENSMVAFVRERERRKALARAVSSSRRAVELVSILYRTGLTDFQNVLDSERTLFDQEDSLAESEGFVTQNLVSLYRALGGGWATDTP